MNQKLTLATIALCLVFISCKKNSTGLIIPKDAAFVLHINSASLISKLSWDDLKKSNWFQDSYQKTQDSTTKKILSDPSSSGIDLKSDFAFFIEKQGRGNYMAFEGKLNDAGAFENLNKKINTGSTTITDGDVKYMKTSDRGLVGWTGTKFIYLTQTPNFNTPFSQGGVSETEPFSFDSLKLFTKHIFQLSSGDQIDEDSHFADLIKENGDMHMWLNSDQMYSNALGGALSMLKMNSLFQGNRTALSLNFEDGKITMNGKTYYGKEMTDLFNKYKVQAADKDLINRIPSDNVALAFVSNYPPEAISEFFKAAGFDGMVNSFLGKYNYNLDQLVHVLKGQVVFAVTDLSMQHETKKLEGSGQTFTTTSPDAHIFFAMSIKDKPQFDKMMNTFTGEMHDSSMLNKVTLKTTADWFAISNAAPAVDGFLSGAKHNNPFVDKINGHPFGMYVDLQKLMNTFKSPDTSNGSMMNASLQMWKDIVMTGGEFKDGYSTARFEVNLVNGKENSLKQLNAYAETLYNYNKKAKQQQETFQMPGDSTVFTPPVITDSAGKAQQ